MRSGTVQTGSRTHSRGLTILVSTISDFLISELGESQLLSLSHPVYTFCIVASEQPALKPDVKQSR